MNMDYTVQLNRFTTVACLRPRNSGVEHPWFRKNSQDLCEAALYSWKNLPAAREAILEYYDKLIQETVSAYVYNMTNNSNGPDTSAAEEAIHLFIETLKKFLQQSKENWISRMFNWSLNVLTKVNRNNSGKRNVPDSSSLNELMQLYTSCKASKSVLDIVDSCVCKMIVSSPDECVNTIVNLPIKYGQHFDWLLTYIGTHYPQLIVGHMLSYGIREYNAHLTDLIEKQHTMSVSQANQKQHEYAAKLQSFARILKHLAQHNASEVRRAFSTAIEEGLSTPSTKTGPSTSQRQERMVVPFLLQLARQSNFLFELLAEDLHSYATPQNLERCRQIIVAIPQQFLLDNQSWSIIIVNLILSLKGSSMCVVFEKLMSLAFDELSAGELSNFTTMRQNSRDILEGIMSHMLRQLHDSTNMCVFLADNFPVLQRVDDRLCATILELIFTPLENIDKRKFYFRLICLVVWFRGISKLTEVFAIVLIASSTEKQLGVFIEFTTVLLPYFPTALHILLGQLPSSLKQICDKIEDGLSQRPTQWADLSLKIQSNWLKNLLLLIQWEKLDNDNVRFLKLQEACNRNFPQVLAFILAHAIPSKCTTSSTRLDFTICGSAVEILTYLNCKIELNIGVIHKAVELDSANGLKTWQKFTDWFLAFCSDQPCGVNLLMNNLMRCCFEKYMHIFKQSADLTSSSTGKTDDNKSIIEANNLAGAKSVVAMVHSGVFKNGRKVHRESEETSQTLARQLLFIHTLEQVCCLQPTVTSEGKTVEKPGASGLFFQLPICKLLASIFLEYVCLDAIAGASHWEDWSQAVWCREKYIQIIRKLNSSSLCWNIMVLLGQVPPAWLLAPVLKACLAYIRTSLEGSLNKNAPCDSTIVAIADRVFYVMNEGKILPVGFVCVPYLLNYITAHEGSVIIADLWKYFQETNPKKSDLEQLLQMVDESKRINSTATIPNPEVEERFLKNLQLIMLANVDKEEIGSLYFEMFKPSS